jgi:hypothetical protein
LSGFLAVPDEGRIFSVSFTAYSAVGEAENLAGVIVEDQAPPLIVVGGIEAERPDADFPSQSAVRDGPSL